MRCDSSDANAVIGMADESFRDFILDQLVGLGQVDCRRMFGGHGLYRGGVFFGILHKDRLYFKTDATSQVDYHARGMKPFTPNAKQTLKNYYEVPADVIEDSDEMSVWAKKAVQAALKGPARKKSRKSSEQ